MLEDTYKVTIVFSCPTRERYRVAVKALQAVADKVNEDKRLFIGAAFVSGGRAFVCKDKRRVE